MEQLCCAGSKADETGASVAPGKNHYSRARVNGATVLQNSLNFCDQTKKGPPPQHSSGGVNVNF